MDTAFIILAVALVAAAAIVAFAMLRKRSELGTDDITAAVRTEADRSRTDSAAEARGLRQEVGGAIRGFQDSFAQRIDAGIEGIRAPVTTIGQKLDADIAKMGLDAATNRETLRQSIETKLDASDARLADSARVLREELTANFTRTAELLSGTIKDLGTQQHERLEKVAQELQQMSVLQTQTQETLRQTVEGRLDAIRLENTAKLDEMRQTVDEKLQTALEKRLGESFRTVSEQLERVYQGLGEMQVLATGVGDLKRVLSNVKVRGILAEYQLGVLLEQFLSPDQYIRNAQVKDQSAERVEYAVRFPGRESEEVVLLPIDAKFPREDYERLVLAAEQANAEAVETAAAALETRVKSFAKSICEKYINPPKTTDFAILFLPTESLFAELLRRPGLQEQLQREYRVTIVGPTTLASLLNAFQMGFRTLAIQKRSSEVWKILGAVRAEFVNHGKVVDTLKKQLNAATNTIDRLGTRTSAMNRKLKDVEMLPTGNAQALLDLAAPLPDDELVEEPGEAAEE